ncbi:carbohydrate-binding module family 50 protein [Lentinula edodes]|uniref:Carbohydrate-binding module family 50 protein n=1 Tax=Lentinula edodes TaxID=5353 RepID=A0A1Q3ED70_LENED|nr:carbohydrate-binding module family 50 protein [Lentinula edodes]
MTARADFPNSSTQCRDGPNTTNYRLPEGMERIGYDSDSGKYIFRDRDGSVWQGPEGAEYGEMTRVSGSSDQEAQAVMEEPSVRADGYQPLATDIHSDTPLAFRRPVNANAYRTLAPFFLLIGVVLLLVWKLTHSGWSTPPSPCPANATTPTFLPQSTLNLSSITSLRDLDFTAGNILILEMTLETVSALTGVNGTAFMSFNHTFDPPVVVPILGTADSGTIDNVLMVQGTINSLNIIPLGELDILDMNITARIGSLGGVGGIPLPFNGLTQSDVPTTLQTISV